MSDAKVSPPGAGAGAASPGLTAADLEGGQYRVLFDHHPQPMWVHDLETLRFLAVNDAALRKYGYRRDELLAMTIAEIRPAEDVPSLLANVSQVSDGVDEAGVWRHRTRDGRLLWVEISSHTLTFGGRPAELVLAVDVTSRHLAAVAELRNQDRQRTLVAELARQRARNLDAQAVAKIGSWETDLETLQVSWSDETCRLFGVSPDTFEPNHHSFLQFVHPEDRGMVDEAFRRSFASREANVIEHRVCALDGSVRVVEEHWRTYVDEAGRPVRAIGTCQDISERWRAEVELRALQDRHRRLFAEDLTGNYLCRADGRVLLCNASLAAIFGLPSAALGFGEDELRERRAAREAAARAEERLAEQAALLDAAHEAILVHDLDGRVSYWNRGAERTYGWSAEEALGKKTSVLLAEAPQQAAAAIAEVLRVGQWQGETHHRTRDGRLRTVDVNATLIRDGAGEAKSVLSINADVTERKSLEAQLLRAQRMESIGTLAGGIAHDLNNVLTPILMAADLLAGNERDPRQLATLRSLEASAQRGADLVRQVLGFARGVEGPRTRVDPAAVAQEVQKIVRETFPRDITFELAVDEQLWPLVADPTQLHQVLMNLCVNARDAMPNGGCLAVSLTNQTIDEVYASMNQQARPGTYLKIQVTDTGCGIPPEHLDRIFEPFFTSKDLGHGTGLGLSTVHSIVRSHRGFVNVYSELGRGAKFEVYLPADLAETTVTAPPVATEPPRGNGELILLVDDEEPIRELAQRTLERFGYRVLPAAQGAEAVSLFVQRRAEIAVVLTDMSMPVMDGPATILALKSIDPRVRIIGTSGLGASQFLDKARSAGVRHFVPKPYTADSLLAALTDILREEP